MDSGIWLHSRTSSLSPQSTSSSGGEKEHSSGSFVNGENSIIYTHTCLRPGILQGESCEAFAISGDAFLHLGEVALCAGQSTSLASSRLLRPVDSGPRDADILLFPVLYWLSGFYNSRPQRLKVILGFS